MCDALPNKPTSRPEEGLEAPQAIPKKAKKLGVKGAAAFLEVSAPTLRNWLNRGHIVGQRLGGPRGNITFTEDYLREFAAGKAEKQRGEATK
jgi:hypothetical protein